MEFKHKKPEASFTLPDKITVRQQLAFYSVTDDPDEPIYVRLWRGAVVLMQDWKCEILPDCKVDLDTITDPRATNIIVWAGIAAKKHLDRLDETPKN